MAANRPLYAVTDEIAEKRPGSGNITLINLATLPNCALFWTPKSGVRGLGRKRQKFRNNSFNSLRPSISQNLQDKRIAVQRRFR